MGFKIKSEKFLEIIQRTFQHISDFPIPLTSAIAEAPLPWLALAVALRARGRGPLPPHSPSFQNFLQYIGDHNMIDRERQILERLELDNDPQDLQQYADAEAKLGRARLAENIPEALQIILDIMELDNLSRPARRLEAANGLLDRAGLQPVSRKVKQMAIWERFTEEERAMIFEL